MKNHFHIEHIDYKQRFTGNAHHVELIVKACCHAPYLVTLFLFSLVFGSPTFGICSVFTVRVPHKPKAPLVREALVVMVFKDRGWRDSNSRPHGS